MSRTVTLRKQHDVIVLLAGEIDTASDAIETRIDAERIVKLLARFDSILTAHLISEDKFLYPAMMGSANTATADTAVRFSREMGGLVEVYSAFAAHWKDPSAVFDTPSKFRSEWSRLLAALSARIDCENTQLYPLADAMDGSGARSAA